MSKKSIVSVFMVALFAIGNVALADVYNGSLSTPDSILDNEISGVVVYPPTANPLAGVYTSTQNVTLTADGASSIYYTTDGSDPTCSTGNTYSGVISVSVSEPIKAISCYSDGASSTVALYLYAINPPSINPAIEGSASGGGGQSSGGGASGVSASTGVVGIADFVLLMENWGKPGALNPADFSGDATIGIKDFIWLMANWNS